MSEERSTARYGQWSELAPEHLIRISMFADKPEVLCRAEVVCSDWRAVLQDGQHQCSWHQLCVQWYPKMASRIFEEATESSPSHGPAPTRAASGSFDLGAGVYSASASSSAVPSYAPSPATGCAASPHLASAAEPLELPLLACDEEADPLRAPAVKCDWRSLFQRRFLRQREWDAEKRRQRRASAKSVGEEEDLEKRDESKKDGKFHPSGRAKVTRGSWDGREKHHHACRLRTCKRCGVAFNPHDRENDGCKWHSGQYVPVSASGATAGSSVGRDFERRAQNIIKAHNRKKGSKQANAIVFDTHGQIQEDGAKWAWTCCGDANLVARGCTSGQHS